MNELQLPPTAAATPGKPSFLRDRVLRPLQSTEGGLLLAIVVVVLLTAVLDENHNYLDDPKTSAIDIIRQTSLLGIFALGAAIVIISGGIDLSSGSVIAFSGTVCATLMFMLAPEAMEKGQEVGGSTIVLAILGTLVVGFLVGSLHAWLITVIGLPPFVATLATLVGLRSLSRAIVESVTSIYRRGLTSTQIEVQDPQFRYLATSVWIPALVFLLVTLLTWLLMSRTVVGRHLHALGGNEQATRLSGIQTDRLKWLAYCLSAILSSIAGILYISQVSVANPQVQGRGYELNAIAAAVVGGCSLQGGVGTIPGTVLGALFLRVVIDGVPKIITRSSDVYEGLIVGGVVVVAVAITQFRLAGRRGKSFFPGGLGLVSIVNLALIVGTLAVLSGHKFATDLSESLRPGETTILGHALLFAGTAVPTFLALLVWRFFEERRRSKA
jgi:ribose/xylose/arabinose/galactoside ABC-type transport system permease subunit